MRLSIAPLFTCLWLLGCASTPGLAREPESYGYRGTQVWVRGPWEPIEPSRNVDDVIDQLCSAVMQMPGAQWRDYGQEYCGLLYTLEDGTYYASHPSPLGPTVLVGPSKRKRCKVPAYVEDDRGQTSPTADFHSHPWTPSPMSQEDRQEKFQKWSIRIQFDTACHIMKLIPHRGESRPGEVYERRDGSWKLTGLIKPEDKADGIITPVDGLDTP